MKSDFDKAIEKARLYSEQAVVVTLSFSNVKVSGTLSDKDGNLLEDNHKEYTPESMTAGFLDYLEDEKIPHAIILQDGNSLTLALPREDDEDEYKADRAREIVAGYFKDGRQVALSSEAYIQKSPDTVKNTLLSPVSAARREVNKFAARCRKS